MGSIDQLQINNDNKQLISVLNYMKPRLQKNANIIPVNVTDLLVEVSHRNVYFLDFLIDSEKKKEEWKFCDFQF